MHKVPNPSRLTGPMRLLAAAVIQLQAAVLEQGGDVDATPGPELVTDDAPPEPSDPEPEIAYASPVAEREAAAAGLNGADFDAPPEGVTGYTASQVRAAIAARGGR